MDDAPPTPPPPPSPLPPPLPPAAAEVLTSPDLLRVITALVPAEDLLCWALGCRAFRAAQVEARPGRITSPIGAFVGSSAERCEWVRVHGAWLVPRREDQTAFCEYAAAGACRSGDLECIRALREGGYGPAAFWWAEDYGEDEEDEEEGEEHRTHVKMVHMCEEAAYNGQLEALQWGRGHGCPWNEETCSNAARGGHLSTLQWAREHGCPWDETTRQEAQRFPEILQWLDDNGAP